MILLILAMRFLKKKIVSKASAKIIMVTSEHFNYNLYYVTFIIIIPYSLMYMYKVPPSLYN